MTVKIDHVIPATDKYGKKYTKRDLTLLKSARRKQDKCTEKRAKYAKALYAVRKIKKLPQYDEYYGYQGGYLKGVKSGDWMSVESVENILDSLTP